MKINEGHTGSMGMMTLLEWCVSLMSQMTMLDTDNMILMTTLLEKCGIGANFDDTDDRVVMDMHKMMRIMVTLLEKKRSGPF